LHIGRSWILEAFCIEVGAPPGEGDGEDEVVVLGLAEGGDLIGVGESGGTAKVAEFVEEGGGGGEGIREEEALVADGDFEAGEEMAPGDVPAGALLGGLRAGGEGDGEEAAGEDFGFEEIDDGLADAGGVDGDDAVAAEVGMAGESADMPDDFGVRRAEREAFEVANDAAFFARVLVGDGVAVAGGDEGAFEDTDGGVIVLLAEIDSDVVADVGRRERQAGEKALQLEAEARVLDERGKKAGLGVAAKEERGSGGEGVVEEFGGEDGVFRLEEFA
jgi:hypothetical protein